MRIASYGFWENPADNTNLGIFDAYADKIYVSDWGYRLPVVKGRFVIPSWMSDNQAADLLSILGCQIISIDQRNANELNKLSTDIDQNVEKKNFKSSYPGDQHDPRRVIFNFVSGESFSLIMPQRKKIKDFLDTVIDATKSKRAILDMKLMGERWVNVIPVWQQTINTVKKPALKSGTRWTGKQTNDIDVRGAFYTFSMKYRSDLGIGGAGKQVYLRGKVASSTDGSGNKVLRPAIIPQATWDRMVKPAKNDLQQVAAKAMKTNNYIESRRVLAQFAVGDQKEGLTGSRFLVSSMEIPLADWAEDQVLGRSNLKGTISDFVNNCPSLCYADYQGENIDRLQMFLEFSRLENLLDTAEDAVSGAAGVINKLLPG